MTPEETREAITVMQHYAYGGEVEYRVLPRGEWRSMVDDEPYWNWGMSEYRIKPKPVEFWITYYPSHTGALRYGSQHLTRSSAERAVKGGGIVLRVIEVDK